MVKDAEAHAEEDRKFQELVNARNQADALVHAAKKSQSELAEQLDEAERKELEDAIAAAEKALESDDLAEIEAKSQQLAEVSGKIAQKAAQQGEQAQGAPGAGAAGGGESRADDDNVVDADFEEVKDDNK
jgi:molecular chaperone DnaK